MNQIDPSEVTTMSLGELKRWSCQWSTTVVTTPSRSLSTRRPPVGALEDGAVEVDGASVDVVGRLQINEQRELSFEALKK